MAESVHPMGLPFQPWVPKKVDVSKWCQAVFVGVFFTPNNLQGVVCSEDLDI